MFLQASVILSTGEGSASVHAGILPPGGDPPGPGTPLGGDSPGPGTPLGGDPPGPGTPWDPQIRHPLALAWSRHPLPQSMLGDTVNALVVLILLECNLVSYCVCLYFWFFSGFLSLFLILFPDIVLQLPITGKHITS